jgi:plasmid maintenance system antidote protein VapI
MKISLLSGKVWHVNRIRLSKAFGGSAESWLRQQMLYDLAQVQQKADSISVKRFEHA